MRRRYFGKDGIAEAGVTLFRPDTVAVTRYRYRGANIATSWNAETLAANQAAPNPATWCVRASRLVSTRPPGTG